MTATDINTGEISDSTATAEPPPNATNVADEIADIPFDHPVNRISTLRYARKFGVLFVLVTLAFGAMSFLILLGLTPIEPTSDLITGVLVLNLLFVTVLLFLVGREVSALIKARKKGRAAARMHIRIVGLFGVVAAFPAIIVAVVAGITLDLGLDRIFDTRTRSIVESSRSVADSYLLETIQSLNINTINMGVFLMQNRRQYVLDLKGFTDRMTAQAKARGLLKADIVLGDSSTLVQANIPFERGAPLPPPPERLMGLAKDGKPACGGPKVRNLAGCVFKLNAFGPDHYLYTLRSVNQEVVSSVKLMDELIEEYKLLESGRLPLQIAFALLYVGICLTILLSAIWMGIAVADRLVEPIRRLISAADEVATGNLAVTVPTSRSKGELRSLTNTFNDMTGELRNQRDKILDTQEQTDRRRRFTEAVLSGVTAGVVGLSDDGTLTIVNKSAANLLDDSGDLVGQKIQSVSPELSSVVSKAQFSRKSVHREQITLAQNGEERTLNVQVSVDYGEEGTRSHVVTIDDITDLVSAQRTSAWADVARRIAHEIKNPLTPIQLSAERIKRRYGKVITEDREVFDQCTDTIVRQVADIGRMVDEFSSFARMPKPSMTNGDLREPIKEAVFLLKVSNPDIEFDVELDEAPLEAIFDARLLGQAFGNLIKNASEAMEGVEFEEGNSPKISIRSAREGDFYRIDVIDNGKGLPVENRQRLLEPYMTTREKGTGLGLAIVGKILEEHGGRIALQDAPAVESGGQGAMVTTFVPISAPSQGKEQGEANGV